MTTPVEALCAEGMMAEAQDGARARRLFAQAWDARTDDADAAVAAHYLARHQATPHATLEWNLRALEHAQRATDRERVTPFLPSLLLCVGKALEDLNRPAEAHAYHQRAAQQLGALGGDGYGRMLKSAVHAALQRTAPVAPP